MSEQGRLGPRFHAGEIGIFAIARPRIRRLFGFPLGPALFFFLLLGLLGPLTIAFRERCFSWSGNRRTPGALVAPLL